MNTACDHSWAWAAAGVGAQANTEFKYLNEFQIPVPMDFAVKCCNRTHNSLFDQF